MTASTQRRCTCQRRQHDSPSAESIPHFTSQKSGVAAVFPAQVTGRFGSTVDESEFCRFAKRCGPSVPHQGALTSRVGQRSLLLFPTPPDAPSAGRLGSPPDAKKGGGRLLT